MAHRKVLGSPLGARLPLEEVQELLGEARRVLASEPSLVEVSAERALFVGDTHGDVHSSLKAFGVSADVYIFLGDYVDRGPMQLENLLFLLAKKLEDPDRVLLLRGNHESPLMNIHYGFFEEVGYRYGPRAYSAFAKVFSTLPYATLVNGSVLALHGGLATTLSSVEDLRRLSRPDELPSDRTAFEVLWNDPSESVRGFAPSPRGPGIYLFGSDVFERFAEGSGIKLLVRAHEYFAEGVHRYFGGRVISVFSCRYYPASRPAALLIEAGRLRPVSLL